MHKSNYVFKKFPRTLNEAFPYTRESSACIYKPCQYDKSIGFLVWVCVVFLSILAFMWLVML